MDDIIENVKVIEHDVEEIEYWKQMFEKAMKAGEKWALKSTHMMVTHHT